MNELVTIEGTIAAGFGGVRDAFEENFRSRGDRGSVCAVYVDGRKVVDLWVGIADYVYVLAHGELVLSGTGRDLRARPDLFTGQLLRIGGRGMTTAITVSITFVCPPDAAPSASESVPAEGVVRLPDDTLRAFSGWMELLAVLELAAVLAVP